MKKSPRNLSENGRKRENLKAFTWLDSCQPFGISETLDDTMRCILPTRIRREQLNGLWQTDAWTPWANDHVRYVVETDRLREAYPVNIDV